jgi:hypothetical protein
MLVLSLGLLFYVHGGHSAVSTITVITSTLIDYLLAKSQQYGQILLPVALRMVH